MSDNPQCVSYSSVPLAGNDYSSTVDLTRSVKSNIHFVQCKQQPIVI